MEEWPFGQLSQFCLLYKKMPENLKKNPPFERRGFERVFRRGVWKFLGYSLQVGLFRGLANQLAGNNHSLMVNSLFFYEDFHVKSPCVFCLLELRSVRQMAMFVRAWPSWRGRRWPSPGFRMVQRILEVASWEYLVVPLIFFSSQNLGKWSNLTNMFSKGLKTPTPLDKLFISSGVFVWRRVDAAMDLQLLHSAAKAWEQMATSSLHDCGLVWSWWIVTPASHTGAFRKFSSHCIRFDYAATTDAGGSFSAWTSRRSNLPRNGQLQETPK